ncbi:MAG: molybdopterin-guanine dinucleotide biosynthesis protein A [Zhongshania sp.]|jgi:molybdopterin-guanine dinucleotide biosynthesis protein A
MAKNIIHQRDVTAIILAGGEGRRMNGQDKGLVSWKQRRLIEYALDAIPSDIAHTLISCNRNIDQYKLYGETVQDEDPTYKGPLAGIYASMMHTSSPFIFVLPCDSPLAPGDVYFLLADALNAGNADICYVHDGEREQYLFALIRTQLKSSLKEYLSRGNRQVNHWYKQHNYVEADLNGQQFAFRNCNTIIELAELK